MSYLRAHDRIDASLLTIVGVISNPARYRARYDLFRKWYAQAKATGANVLVVELAYGARPFEVTEAGNPWHLQLRTNCEMWHKENMINCGIRHLTKIHPSWEYVVWEDCDISHHRDDWATETVHALQHHAFIQTWVNAAHVDARGNIIRIDYSFCSSYLKSDKRATTQADYDAYYHSGFSWGARRDELEKVGLLIDQSLIGAADHQMAHALIGNVDRSYHGQVSAGYKSVFDNWQARALKYVQKNIGCIDGHITHGWHGSRTNRRYVDRWSIVINSEFDPARDLTMDSQGVYQLNDLSPHYVYLRNALQFYFSERDEDSTYNHDASAPLLTKCPPPPVSPLMGGIRGKVTNQGVGPDGKPKR